MFKVMSSTASCFAYNVICIFMVYVSKLSMNIAIIINVLWNLYFLILVVLVIIVGSYLAKEVCNIGNNNR